MNRHSIEVIARALNDAKVPFIVVGGLAVIAHGYGRSTQDLVLVVQLQPDTIRAWFAAFESLGYRPIVAVTAEGFADAQQRARWIAEKGMTVLNFYSDQHRETPIDVFASEPFDFQTEHDAALIDEIAPGVAIRIVRLETLLQLKRQSGRPQDLADIAELQLLHRGSQDA